MQPFWNRIVIMVTVVRGIEFDMFPTLFKGARHGSMSQCLRLFTYSSDFPHD